jgi:hypothetical protein
MVIKEQDIIGTYVLILYNDKYVEWLPRPAAEAEGDVSPPSKPLVRRPTKATG